jgi:hypothetical protein
MAANQNNSFFARLLAPMLGQLQRIAGGSHGDQTVDDLTSEAWIAAHEISEEHGVEFEPEDETFQQAILSKIRKVFGKFADRKMRYAKRLDQEHIGDDGDALPNSLSATLAGPDSYQPEIALEMSEEHAGRAQFLTDRFTEAIAYLRTLDHFDHDHPMIASHLAITEGALKSRLGRAEMMAELQPSLFDGVEVIPRDFVPLPGHPRVPAWKPRSRWGSLCLSAKRCQLRLFSLRPALFHRT